MKRCILTLLMALFSAGAVAQSGADWMFRLTAGAAFPAGAASGAPELSTSFTAGLRALVVPHSFPIPIAVCLDGVHWLSSPAPDRSAVPIDEGLYVKRALHFPVTVGVWIPLFGGRGLWSDLTVTLGPYWRNLNLQRMAAPGVMDDMEEHGWGLAWKIDFETVIANRLSLGVSYLAFGNLFGTCNEPPAGTSTVNADGIRRSQPTLDGYGQGFLTISLGYHLLSGE